MKRSINTSFLKDFKILEDIIDVYLPNPGDIALFQINRIGITDRVFDTHGNLIPLCKDDYFLSSFGNTFKDQNLIGIVPSKPERNLFLFNPEGTIGKVKLKVENALITQFTKVTLIGYAVDIDENIFNLKDLNPKQDSKNRNPVIEFFSMLGIFLSIR